MFLYFPDLFSRFVNFFIFMVISVVFERPALESLYRSLGRRNLSPSHHMDEILLKEVLYHYAVIVKLVIPHESPWLELPTSQFVLYPR